MPLLGHFLAYARDPLGFVTRVSAEYGGIVPFRLGPYPALLLTDPDAIEEVLVAKSRDRQHPLACELARCSRLIVPALSTWR